MSQPTRKWWPVDPFDPGQYTGATPPPMYAHVEPLPAGAGNTYMIGWQVQQPQPPEKYLPIEHARIETRAWCEWHWYRGINPNGRVGTQRTPRKRTSGRVGKQRRIRGSQRLRIIERDGLICGLCGGDVPANRVDIDHIIPSSLGGTDDDHNLQVTHQSCNRRKGARV
jgi:5-methylcytosine-specific restriction endonuclease McrA